MKNKKFGIVVINDDFFLNFCRDFKPRVVTLSQNTRGLPTEMAQSRMEHTNALLGQWKESEKERRDKP